jgi:hypothetical protein
VPAATVAAAVGFGVGTDPPTVGEDSAGAAMGQVSDSNPAADEHEAGGALGGSVAGEGPRPTGGLPASDDEVSETVEVAGRVHGLLDEDR